MEETKGGGGGGGSNNETAVLSVSVLGGAPTGLQRPVWRAPDEDVAAAMQPVRVVQPAPQIQSGAERADQLQGQPFPHLSAPQRVGHLTRQWHLARYHVHGPQHRLPPPLLERLHGLRRDHGALVIQVQLHVAEAHVHLLVGVGEVGEDGQVGVEGADVDVGTVEGDAGDLEPGIPRPEDEVDDEDGEPAEDDGDPEQSAERRREPCDRVSRGRRLRPEDELGSLRRLVVRRVACSVLTVHGEAEQGIGGWIMEEARQKSGGVSIEG